MEKVKELIESIHGGLTQASSSSKDEVRVMRAMLNDTSYTVDVYGKEGKIGEYCPAEDARALAASIIQGSTKVSAAEAKELAAGYEFKKADAVSMIGISKEFVNTYLDTGRKMSFGNREKSSLSLSQKEKEASTCTYPKKVGVDVDGKGIYETATANVPAYKEIKATSRPNYK